MSDRQYPTREQIAVDLIEKLRQTQGETIDLIWQRWQRLFREYDDAVLALFPQPTQECGVCGRQYPADDPRDTCPVCWPGFGEHGQQAATSAEPRMTCGEPRPHDSHEGETAFGAEPDIDWVHWKCPGVPLAAPPSITDMAPGSRFTASLISEQKARRFAVPEPLFRWWVIDTATTLAYAISGIDPSTIRDVQAPPATPEAN